MKRRILCSLCLVALAVWAYVEASPPAASLAAYAPPGALLVLEAKDFAGLLHDWNASREKTAWLASANYRVFENSRLYLRFSDAQKEFAAAAGVSPDMNLLNSVAGTESMLALYDIGKLQFLYVTKLASARALETMLWKTRSSYETRNAAGTPYFIKTDPASRRVAAFAAAGGHLVLSTREDLIAGALSLIAGQPGASVPAERWYVESARAAGPRGDLRLVLKTSELVESPYFRSYWIQRNASEVRQFDAAICDLHREAGRIREERVLVRFDKPAASESLDAVASVLRMVPDEAGLYRAWARPTAATALELLRSRIIAPDSGAAPPSESAPEISVTPEAGTEAELETRIDEPPLSAPVAAGVPEALKRVVEAEPLEAMLHVGATRDVGGGVFVGIDSAIVLLRASDWDAAAVRSAFAEIDGYGALARFAAEVHGRVLIAAATDVLAKKIAALAAQSAAATNSGTDSYTAVFRHARERQRFLKMTRLLDYSLPRPDGSGPREPRFLSENIGSLSRTLARIETASIRMHDAGSAVTETVIYELGK